MMEKKNQNALELHEAICAELHSLYCCKNHDYGDSFAQARMRIPAYTLGKLYDKYMRLETLMLGAPAAVTAESIDDTLMDLANYAIMELTERRKARK